MTTPRIHSVVSLAAALTFTLTLGACAGSPSRVVGHGPAPIEETAATVHFDNGGRDYVHVYLVGEKREWLLGRVEPGAHATLRIPEDALAESPRAMRLAVLSGEHVSQRVRSNARAAFTMAQPATEILAQRWTFSPALANGQLTSLKMPRQ
ncbi:MAG TPA: hypothetical protein VGP25_04025 [Gemmatimonadaceae bacterium]|nr:hypothetical protein [Gemmatimonadaceae bacterium]